MANRRGKYERKKVLINFIDFNNLEIISHSTASYKNNDKIYCKYSNKVHTQRWHTQVMMTFEMINNNLMMLYTMGSGHNNDIFHNCVILNCLLSSHGLSLNQPYRESPNIHQ